MKIATFVLGSIIVIYFSLGLMLIINNEIPFGWGRRIQRDVASQSYPRASATQGTLDPNDLIFTGPEALLGKKASKNILDTLKVADASHQMPSPLMVEVLGPVNVVEKPIN